VVLSCRHRVISRKHVFFGGEDPNSYAENFANTLRSQGWLVANVINPAIIYGNILRNVL
jgi:hypothetical protein